MTFLEPDKSDVQKAMKSLAASLAEKAADLTAFADSLDDLTVEQATAVRPSDTTDFERTFSEVFARSQREQALIQSHVNADLRARDEAGL